MFFQSIYNRNLFLFKTISLGGSLYFYGAYYTLYLLEKGFDLMQINAFWGIIVVTMFLAEIPTGLLADLLGKKRAVQIALGLQALGEFIFAFSDGYSYFVLAAVIGGIGFAFGSGSLEALIYETLKREDKQELAQKILGEINSLQALGMVGGSFGASLLIKFLWPENYFLPLILLTALSVTIAFFASFFLVEEENQEVDSKANSLQILKTAVNLFLHNSKLRTLAFLFIFSTSFGDYLFIWAQPYFTDRGLSEEYLGYLIALGFSISFILQRKTYLLEKYLGLNPALSISIFVPALLYLLLGLIYNLELALISYLLLAGSHNLSRPIFSDYLNREIEDRQRSTALSLISSISGLYVAVAGLVLGKIGDLFSIQSTFLFAGFFILMLSLVFWKKNLAKSS